MTVDGSGPLVANSARGLGVRLGTGPTDDIPVTPDGVVVPGTGGMSVGPKWRDLPEIRIPHRLREKGVLNARGKDNDACWRLGEGPFLAGRVAEGLGLRPDRSDHGTIEPTERAKLNKYLDDLAATRDSWVIDET
jgi:hypothetical protein